MPEILTESFCERCGTRYTFESSAPKARRLGRFKTISRGLKNFVMSDDTSLDEALAAARSDEEREATAQQLDAFHKTFNFCMTCRQYTCANCWNEADGRCLTCAPHLGHEILPAPFPTLDPAAGLSIDLTAGTANGHVMPEFDEAAWPVADLPAAPEPEPAPPAAVEPVAAGEPAAPGAAAPEPTAPGLAEPTAPGLAEPVEPSSPEPEPVAAASGEPTAFGLAEPVQSSSPEPEPVAAASAIPPTSETAAPTVEPARAEGRTVDDKTRKAAAQTAELLARFRPGQSLDEALEAFEAAAAAEAAARPAPAAEPAVPAAEPAAPEPLPEPVTAEQQPEPAARAQDRVEQPAWQLVAPDTPLRAADGHPAETQAAPPPPPASEAPQWPATPQWPQPAEPSDSLAFLTARGRGSEDLWTASSRDLMAAAPTGATVGGVQSCVSCGLSLSATARFCRRCGTRQTG